jgi:hypothetical protein
MSEEGNSLVIDLGAVRSKPQLLELLGHVLELGGPQGNIPVIAVNANKGWGMNWDALYDSLTYLNTGGIWGNSRKLRFPLRIEFTGSNVYRSEDASGFETFSEILERVRGFYAKRGLSFEYAIK